jgi:hypothetical protein
MQFNEKATQAQIGRAIGVSERSVRKFLKKHNIKHKDYNLGDLILRYIEELRKTASGRDSGNVDITKEKGLLLRAKRKLAEKRLEEEKKDDEFQGYVKDEFDKNRIELCEVMGHKTKDIISFTMIMIASERESEMREKTLKAIIDLDNSLTIFLNEHTEKKEGEPKVIQDTIRRIEDVKNANV